MVTQVKEWGKWYLVNSNLCIRTPGNFVYQIPVADLKDERTIKIWIGQLAVKPWINDVQDLFDFRAAARELSEVNNG